GAPLTLFLLTRLRPGFPQRQIPRWLAAVCLRRCFAPISLHLLDVAAQLARYGQCEISGEESSVTFNSDLYVPIGRGVTYLGGCLERDLCPLTDDFRCGKNGVGDQVKRDLGVCCLFW